MVVWGGEIRILYAVHVPLSMLGMITEIPICLICSLGDSYWKKGRKEKIGPR